MLPFERLTREDIQKAAERAKTATIGARSHNSTNENKMTGVAKGLIVAGISVAGLFVTAVTTSLIHYKAYMEPTLNRHLTDLKAVQMPFVRERQAANYALASRTFLNSAWHHYVSDSDKAIISDARRQAEEFVKGVQAEREAREAREAQKAAVAKWGSFFADESNQQAAIRQCTEYAFNMTGQERSWFFDDRTNFQIMPLGDKVWVGGPITVKVKGGNVDGSTREYQRGVDCYWSKNASSLEGGTIQVD